MQFRTRLSLNWLETRDVPDGTMPGMPGDPPPPPGGYNPVMPSYDPGVGAPTPGSMGGPIGGGGTYQAPPPPMGP